MYKLALGIRENNGVSETRKCKGVLSIPFPETQKTRAQGVPLRGPLTLPTNKLPNHDEVCIYKIYKNSADADQGHRSPTRLITEAKHATTSQTLSRDADAGNTLLNPIGFKSIPHFCSGFYREVSKAILHVRRSNHATVETKFKTARIKIPNHRNYIRHGEVIAP